jgi:hypothetical protein
MSATNRLHHNAVSPDPLFLALVRRAQLPTPTPEYLFHPVRKWRIDWAWPDYRVGLEVDGGIWHNGRHTRGAGWLKDSEKLNCAAALGWRMLRVTPAQLHDLTTITLVADCLAGAA